MKNLHGNIADMLGLSPQEAERLKNFPTHILESVLKSYNESEDNIIYPVGWFFKTCELRLREKPHPISGSAAIFPNKDKYETEYNRNHSPLQHFERKIENPEEMAKGFKKIVESSFFASLNEETKDALRKVFRKYYDIEKEIHSKEDNV